MQFILKIIIPVLILNVSALAQNKNKKTDSRKTVAKKETSANTSLKLFTVTGYVSQTSSYCGGAAPTDEMLREIEKPAPYPNKNFYIKKGNKNNLKEAVILNFKTDAAGNYSFQLTPGIYSVLLEPQLKALNLKEYNQSGHISADEECLKKWWAKAYYVLEITDKNINGLNFSFHHPCFVSGDIPCLQYEGPMPP
jgi:hypothetical protein